MTINRIEPTSKQSTITSAVSDWDAYAGEIRAEIKAIESVLTEKRRLSTLRMELAAETIIAVTAEAFGITYAQLMSKTRAPQIVLPRQVAMALVWELNALTYRDVGKIFEKDPGTVCYARQAVSDCEDIDPKFAAVLLALREKVKRV